MDHDIELLEALVADFTDRCRRGDPPSVEDYAARHPELADEIRDLFPTVRSVEDLKRHRASDASWAVDTPPECRPHALTSADSDLQPRFHPAQQPDEIGRLASYRILKPLGVGGMGAVFVAEDLRLRRPVALKVMLPRIAHLPNARERFLREARAAAALRHDHIVSPFEVGEDRGQPFIVMPLLEGVTLEDRLRSGSPPEIAEILRIGREIADGLAAAHQRGLIHRDIKPSNVFLESRRHGSDLHGSGVALPPPRVKLLDFGLACDVDRDAHLTATGFVVGSPAYMAPEQARGETIDARADLFSLGVILYRLCTGRLPFDGANANSVLMAMASQQPTPPHTRNPQVPQPLSRLILRLLEKDRDQRPATAVDVANALRALEAEPASPRPTPALLSHAGRERTWGIVLAVVLAGFVPILWHLASVTLRVEGPEGTLIVKLDDPNLLVSIQDDGKTVVHDKSTQRTFSMKSARGEVQVFDASGAQLLITKRFEMRQGDRTTLEVSANELRPPEARTPSARTTVKIPAIFAPLPWQSMFNGKDLAGWKRHPLLSGDWTVVDGLLVGRGTGLLNRGWLFSERGDIGDFHLRAEFRADAGCDSGIFFWTPFEMITSPQGRPLPPYWHEANIAPGGDRFGTGSLDGQQVTAPAQQTPSRPETWTRLNIIARGKQVFTLVDGAEVARLAYPVAKRGHIALQTPGAITTSITFRSIEIKIVEPARLERDASATRAVLPDLPQ